MEMIFLASVTKTREVNCRSRVKELDETEQRTKPGPARELNCLPGQKARSKGRPAGPDVWFALHTAGLESCTPHQVSALYALAGQQMEDLSLEREA